MRIIITRIGGVGYRRGGQTRGRGSVGCRGSSSGIVNVMCLMFQITFSWRYGGHIWRSSSHGCARPGCSTARLIIIVITSDLGGTG